MKDFLEAKCRCGKTFIVPYPSMQKMPPVAPSNEELKAVNEHLTMKLTTHQNKNKTCLN